jgi:hypothetical protein
VKKNQTSNLFSYGKEVGTVSKKLERSFRGLVASRVLTRIIFGRINDSGNPAANLLDK